MEIQAVAQPVEALRNAFKIPELKQRMIFTLLMLAVYRIGAQIPTPGIDGVALARQVGEAGGLLGFYDLFTGGAFAQATIFALGIMPYISASIIMQLLTAVVPTLEKLSKEGEEGRKKITEYTRYATIGLCMVQSIGMATLLQGYGEEVVPNPGFGFVLLCMVTFTTGTTFLMWLGEQISERGVGNGISLIIFISIVSGAPTALGNLGQLVRAGEIDILQVGILVIVLVCVTGFVVMMTQGQRRIPVQYPRQVKGRRVFAGARNYLPLRVNQAGVIPIIFASSILMLPSMVGQALDMPAVANYFQQWQDGFLYNALYIGMIMFFCFFYTAITFNPVEVADNMKKYGGVVVGVRPGKATAEYLQHVMTRVTVVGAVFLSGVALLPQIAYHFLGIYDWHIASFFGGTSLLILVGVGLDTVRQIEQHLVMRNYEGFMKGRRVRGRRG